MARKKAEAFVDYSDRESNTIFGWCSTNQHKNCVVEFPGHKCDCKCHGKTKKG